MSLPSLTWCTLLIGAITACVGCGGSAVHTHPVSGQVLVQNQPAAGAVVIFHPQTSDERIAKLRPYGTVGADGRFRLSCLSVEDGAPAGDYAVTITWEYAGAAAPESDPEAVASMPDRLGGRYADPQTSNLKAIVNSGTSELPPFNIQ